MYAPAGVDADVWASKLTHPDPDIAVADPITALFVALVSAMKLPDAGFVTELDDVESL